jgi:hypothetical protein
VTDEVKFTDAQWDALAQAAEAFASVLEAEKVRLRAVAAKNWAGQCGEGNGIIENLRELIHGENGSLAEAVTSEAEYLKVVAVQCRRSKERLAEADSASAEQF